MSLDLVIETIFDDPSLTVEAAFYPQAGDMFPLRLRRRKPTETFAFEGAVVATDTVKLRARAADFPERPAIGDRIVVDGTSYEIQADPIRSTSGLTLSLDVRPA